MRSETKKPKNLFSIKTIKKHLASSNQESLIKYFFKQPYTPNIWDEEQKKEVSVIDFLELQDIDTVLKILGLSKNISNHPLFFFAKLLGDYDRQKDSDSTKRLLKKLFNSTGSDTAKFKVLQALSNVGNPFYGTPLHKIAINQNSEAKQLCLDNLFSNIEKIQDLDQKWELSQKTIELLCSKDGLGMTPLHYFVKDEGPAINQQWLTRLLDCIEKFQNPVQKEQLTRPIINIMCSLTPPEMTLQGSPFLPRTLIHYIAASPSSMTSQLLLNLWFSFIGSTQDPTNLSLTFQNMLTFMSEWDFSKQQISLLHYLVMKKDPAIYQLLLENLSKYFNKILDPAEKQQAFQKILDVFSCPYPSTPPSIFLQHIVQIRDSKTSGLLLTLLFDYIKDIQNSAERNELFRKILGLMKHLCNTTSSLHYITSKQDPEIIQRLLNLLFSYINEIRDSTERRKLFNEFLDAMCLVDQGGGTPLYFSAVRQGSQTSQLLLTLLFGYIKDPTEQSELSQEIFKRLGSSLSSPNSNFISIFTGLAHFQDEDCNNKWLDTALSNIQDINQLVEFLLCPANPVSGEYSADYLYALMRFQSNNISDRLIDYLIENKDKLNPFNGVRLLHSLLISKKINQNSYPTWKLDKFKIDYQLVDYSLNDEDYLVMNSEKTVFFERKSNKDWWIHGKANGREFHHKVGVDIELDKSLNDNKNKELQIENNINIIEKCVSVLEKNDIETTNEKKIKNFMTTILKNSFEGLKNGDQIDKFETSVLEKCVSNGFPDASYYLSLDSSYNPDTSKGKLLLYAGIRNGCWKLLPHWIEKIEKLPMEILRLISEKFASTILYDLNNFEDSKIILKNSKNKPEEIDKGLKDLYTQKNNYPKEKLDLLNGARKKLGTKNPIYHHLFNKSYLLLGRELEKNYRLTKEDSYKQQAKECYEKISPGENDGLTGEDYSDAACFYESLCQELLDRHDFALLSDNIKLKKNTFYVRMLSNNKIGYAVIDPKGERVIGKIEKEKLKSGLSEEKLTLLEKLEEEFYPEKLKPFLLNILKITSKKYHTSIDEFEEITKLREYAILFYREASNRGNSLELFDSEYNINKNDSKQNPEEEYKQKIKKLKCEKEELNRRINELENKNKTLLNQNENITLENERLKLENQELNTIIGHSDKNNNNYNNNDSRQDRADSSEATLHRKGLESISQEALNSLTFLPMDYTMGAAINGGGCFFDAIAQAVNAIENTTRHSEKTMRMLCHQYYLANKEKVNEWNKEDYQGIDKGAEYLVQYTQQEIDDLFKGKKVPVWGRPHIEGRMIYEALLIKGLHIIKIQENPMDKKLIASHHFVTEDGLKLIEKPSFHEKNIPLLVVSQQDLHFVPVLPTAIMQTQDTHYPLDSQSHNLNTNNNTSLTFFKKEKPNSESDEKNFYFDPNF